MPVHINYVNNYNMYYPSVVLDRHGDMIHLMTNHGCDYRFQEMPDGEGTISGIIVHEPCTFFVKDGDIGCYQIRNVTRQDIALEESDANAFSAIAVEWCPRRQGRPRLCVPPVPASGERGGQSPLLARLDRFRLSFLSHYGWLAIGSAYRANSAKEGETLNSASWGHKLLWDTANGTGYSLLFEFSTQNIESSQCSFAFTCRYHSAQGGLRYWTAEYSTDGDTWKRLGDFYGARRRQLEATCSWNSYPATRASV